MPRTPKFSVKTGRRDPRALAQKLNQAFDTKVSQIVGDGIIEASRVGENVALRLKVENLLPRIPKVSGTVRVLIHSARTGNGWYKGYVWTNLGTTADTTVDVVEGNVGTQGEEVSIRNLNENNAATNIMVDAANAFEILWRGAYTGEVDENGLRVVEINGFFGGCS